MQFVLRRDGNEMDCLSADQFQGRRGYVTADAEMLESWLRDSVFWRRNDFDHLREIERSRALRAEMRDSRAILRENLASLKAQAALLHRRTELLQRR